MIYYLFYEVIIRLYGAGIFCASFFYKKAAQWIEGRQQKMCFTEGAAWFHFSSTGEFNDGVTFLKNHQKEFPDRQILITFFSSTGYFMIREKYPEYKHVNFMPLDTRINAYQFIEMVKPTEVFFTRNDIWPNYLMELGRRKIPVYLISFIVNEKSNFFKPVLRDLYARAFAVFSVIYAVDSTTDLLIRKNGFNSNVQVVGNCRADKVISKESDTIRIVREFKSEKILVVLGSAHRIETEIFLNIFVRMPYEIKWVIVPHEINEKEIMQIQERIPSAIKFTDDSETESNFLIVDKVGLLEDIYQYANLSFIGGGFYSFGIHNILEPAKWSNFICFGPNIRGYSEAAQMIAQGSATVIRREEDFGMLIKNFMQNPVTYAEKGKLNRAIIEKMAGATSKIMEHYKNQIPN